MQETSHIRLVVLKVVLCDIMDYVPHSSVNCSAAAKLVTVMFTLSEHLLKARCRPQQEITTKLGEEGGLKFLCISPLLQDK